MYDLIPKIYGISQDPESNDYIIVTQDIYSSGNKEIDDFIQKMQSKRSSHNDIIFEWIPYNQFNNIEEIGKGGFAKVYSAIWHDGPLSYYNKESKRKFNKKVALKCLHDSQNITDEFLNEV